MHECRINYNHKVFMGILTCGVGHAKHFPNPHPCTLLLLNIQTRSHSTKVWLFFFFFHFLVQMNRPEREWMIIYITHKLLTYLLITYLMVKWRVFFVNLAISFNFGLFNCFNSIGISIDKILIYHKFMGYTWILSEYLNIIAKK